MGLPAPTAEDINAMFHEARREQAFWADSYRRMVQLYPDLFVAVHQGKVVATGADLDTVSAELRAAGLQPGDAWVRFMMATPIHFVL